MSNTTTMRLDDKDGFLRGHLEAWLKRNGHVGDTRKLIEAQLAIDPKQIDRMGWPEILALAQRNQKAGAQ